MSRTVLITGASRGIGRATAKAFAALGDRVAVNYHQNEQAARSLCVELSPHGQVLAVQADVADPVQVREMFESVRASFGPVDVLVNNAGIARQAMLCDVSWEEWQRVFAVNVGGVFHCCRAAMPDMIHRKAGCIINLSSMWGITGASCEVPYSSAKAAVIGFTKALAKELGPSQIRVNCVAPGVIETDMNASLTAEDFSSLAEETPLGRIGTPEEVAQTIVFLASPGASFLTGQVISPNGGFVV